MNDEFRVHVGSYGKVDMEEVRAVFRLDESGRGFMTWDDIDELFKTYNVMLTSPHKGTRKHPVTPEVDIVVNLDDKDHRFNQR